MVAWQKIGIGGLRPEETLAKKSGGVRKEGATRESKKRVEELTPQASISNDQLEAITEEVSMGCTDAILKKGNLEWAYVLPWIQEGSMLHAGEARKLPYNIQSILERLPHDLSDIPKGLPSSKRFEHMVELEPIKTPTFGPGVTKEVEWEYVDAPAKGGSTLHYKKTIIDAKGFRSKQTLMAKPNEMQEGGSRISTADSRPKGGWTEDL